MFFNFDIDFDNIQRRSLPFSTVTLQESINTFKKWHLNKLSPFEKLIVSVKQVLMVGMFSKYPQNCLSGKTSIYVKVKVLVGTFSEYCLY